MEHRELTWTMWRCIIAIGMCCSPAVSASAADVNCGAYCLYVGLKGLDIALPPFDSFEKSLGVPSREGYSIEQLGNAASLYGAHFTGVRTDLGNLAARKPGFACIALLREGHFVLISDFDERTVKILDPPREKSIPVDTLDSVWDGVALLVSKTPLDREEDLGRAAGVARYSVSVAILLFTVSVVIALMRRNRSFALRCLWGCSLAVGIVGCGERAAPSRVSRPVAQSSVPLIGVDRSDVELGEVPISAERALVEVSVTNNGMGSLRIERVKTSCGCAAAKKISQEISTGEVLKIPVALDCAVPGPRSATVLIESNDAKRPTLPVRITWHPVGRFALKPEILNCGDLGLNAEYQFDVDVLVRQSGSGQPIPQIKRVLCSPSENLDCTLSAKQDGYSLTERLKTAGRREDVEGRIVICADNDDLPECMLPVRFRVVPSIDVRPESLYLGTGVQGDVASGTFVVTANTSEVL